MRRRGPCRPTSSRRARTPVSYTHLLVVREASHPSNYDILVLVDLGRAPAGGGDPFAAEEIAAALSLTASISYDLLRQDLCHKVASMTGDRLVDTMVDAPASFDAMLDALVSMPMPATSGACLHLFDQYLSLIHI